MKKIPLILLLVTACGLNRHHRSAGSTSSKSERVWTCMDVGTFVVWACTRGELSDCAELYEAAIARCDADFEAGKDVCVPSYHSYGKCEGWVMHMESVEEKVEDGGTESTSG